MLGNPPSQVIASGRANIVGPVGTPEHIDEGAILFTHAGTLMISLIWNVSEWRVMTRQPRH